MKKIIYVIASLALVLTGCAKPEKFEAPVNEVTIIEAYSPEDTKTALNGLSVEWSVGDQINVNGVLSNPLEAAGRKATFRFDELLNHPFYSVYNGARCDNFVFSDSNHSCHVNLESPQTYVENSFDPGFSTYWGWSESTPQVSFKHAMAYIKITPTAGTPSDAQISYIKLTSRSHSETLSGKFNLSFEDGALTPVADYDGNNDNVKMQAPTDAGVELGNPFIIAVPPQNYTAGLTVCIVSTDGEYMTRNLKQLDAKVGTIYPITTPFTSKGNILVATSCEVSSSTVSFTWGYPGASVEADINHNYEFGLYRDAACRELVVSYKSDAQSDAEGCWGGCKPKFCFGGLEPETTYYFKVTDSDNTVESEVVSATTTAFTNIQMPSTSASVNTVILAEDFSEVIHGGEFVIGAASAAACEETGNKDNEEKVFENLSGKFPVPCYLMNAGSEHRLLKNKEAKKDTRLKDWSYAATRLEDAVYSHVGCVKMSTQSQNTWLTTPVLSAIPDGKKADLEITLTLAAYNNTAVPETFVYACNIEDGALFSEDQNVIKSEKIETTVGQWETYTVTLSGVDNTMRLAIGPDTGTKPENKGQGRMLINDIQVKVTSLSDFGATATEVSSSTVSFEWWYDSKSPAENANLSYEFGLYRDAACTDLVVSHTTAANHQCWKGVKPKFCFGGLAQNTTYYFKVKDTTDSKNPVESGVASAKTTSFANVTMPTSPASAGDVILAEDFSEVILGGEFVIGAASAAACDKLDGAEPYVYTTLSGEFPNPCYLCKPEDERGLTNATAKAGKRLEKWSYAFNSSSSVYSHVGCVKVGTGSNNTWLTTPVLSAIPKNKTADLEITLTLAAYDNDAVKTAFVYACNVAEQASITGATNVIESSQITTTAQSWKTYTVTLSGVDNTMRLAIGPDKNVANTPKGKGRMLINDIVVKVTAISGFAATATEVSSSTVSFEWGYAGATGAANANHNYEFGLYRDAACTQLVVSHTTAAQSDDKGCWKARKPKFCFGGLDPETTYYFKVTDSAGSVSAVASATTTAFTPKTMPTSPASVGDVILAEDFSEIIYGGEAVIGAASAALNDTDDAIFTKPSGPNPSCVFKQDTNEKNIMVSQRSATRLAAWRYAYLNKSEQTEPKIYSHVGHIKLGVGNFKSYAITPALSAIPEGKTADLEITVTLACYTGATNKAIVAAVTGTENGDIFKVDNYSANKCSDITTEVGKWKTYTVTLNNVTRDQRLAIGPATGNDENKSRMLINDIVVKVTALK